ncbi:hypothetical protein [Micrococcus luteus]|nr:hypothetical protein [Micrococcus luteus]
MTATEMIALQNAMEEAFAELSESDIDRMLKEQNANVRSLMAALV